MTAFEEMGVMPELAQAVEEMDWMLPTDIQNEAVPLILGGGDVLMAAETGSGKTGAFCLPVLQIVHETLKDIMEGKTSKVKTKTGNSKWKMNMFDRGDQMAIDGAGLLCQARDPRGWHGTRSNKAVVNSGKYYYEARVTDEGLCRVGWSTAKAKHDVGTDKESYGFGGTGKKSFNRQFDTYGESYGLNDVIGCFLDLDTGIIKWSKNGRDFGKGYDLDKQLYRSSFHASVTLKNAEICFNFGDTPFKHPPPAGWTALCEADQSCVIDSQQSMTVSSKSSTAKNAPQAIIIEPSRELAEQTFNQIKLFKKHLGAPVIKEVLVTGGGDASSLLSKIREGVDIVVATPGKLEDLISSNHLSLAGCRFFVLDEVDGLLSQGHGELINRMHSKIPKITTDGKRLQMIVCSATLHNFDVKKMAERLMSFPSWVDLKGQDSVPETVHHVVCLVDPKRDARWKSINAHVKTDGVHLKDNIQSSYESPEMLSEAIKLLKGEYCVAAIEQHKMDRAIIFCRTKLDCDNMEKYLQTKGGGPNARANHQFSCVCLHSDRRPQERKANLERFKKSEVRFLICTDVAARGLDISGLPFVINVTLPDEKQNYVHRIGRVGRADRMGLAISLVAADKEKVWYHSNCSNRGRGCFNTRLTDQGGCCIWYNEPQYLADIEEHLGVTIDQVEADLKVPINDFDGKVTYGQRRKDSSGTYKGHVQQLAPTVTELAQLETRAQSSFLRLRFDGISKGT